MKLRPPRERDIATEYSMIYSHHRLAGYFGNEPPRDGLYRDPEAMREAHAGYADGVWAREAEK